MTERLRSRSAPSVSASTPTSDYASIVASAAARGGPYIMRRATAVPGYRHTETGIFILDLALLGGMPDGLVSMIYGNESAGKTTLAARTCASLQRKFPDKNVLYVDFEHTFDTTWGAKHGVDIDRLYICEPNSGEEGVDIIDACLKSTETAAVVVDSLPAIIPMKEQEASAEDPLVAIRARLIGRLCSVILNSTNEARMKGSFPSTLLINQWRTKIGVFKGDPRVLPGGKQPNYLATTKIEIKNAEELGKNERGVDCVIRNHHSFLLKKSKVGNSLREGAFDMVRDPFHPLGEGAIDEMSTVCSFAKKFNLITGGGASWRVDGVNHKFSKGSEIETFFYENDEELLTVKRRIIMAQRLDMGLSALPPDNYLLGWVNA